jgi:hypothetical protein
MPVTSGESVLSSCQESFLLVNSVCNGARALHCWLASRAQTILCLGVSHTPHGWSPEAKRMRAAVNSDSPGQ